MTASFDLNCGSLDVATRPGNDWSVDAAYRGEAPTLDVGDDTLDLTSPSGLGVRRQDWKVTLPADQAREISIESNARPFL